ncbi:ExeA family protein [Kangiella sp. TOML190]|uniref:ExeA family protein n=1 Tax=Kangiella sp. TOML190 TaxID=2931351 RepID=UPI00203A9C6E|nr:AAA family ATPase [Kangiella sp. TOML190]
MYNDFFGLKETPFTISPDPRYLFMSERHRDALAHLLYGIGEGGGFVLLTGEVGTGKTTVCRCLLEQLPDNVRLAYILNPKLNSVELMATMCDELGISYDKGEKSLKAFTDLLSNYLLQSEEKGLNTVLMIDEAQNLSVDVLEQIRLLTNLETNKKKLLQIILIGQPELQELLAKKELRQLAQRITARYHLRPLSLAETKAYIEHRLKIAGVTRPIFTKKAIGQIHKSSQGVPRLINVISDRAMLGAFAEHQHRVKDKIVNKAVNEVLGKNNKPQLEKETSSSVGYWKLLASAVALALLITLGWYLFQDYQQTQADERDKFVMEQERQRLKLEQQLVSTQQALAKASLEKDSQPLAEQFWGKQSWDRQGDLAAQNLFALWGLEYLPFQSAQACEFARQYSLECDNGVADWAFVEQLNRPVNLKFQSATDGFYWGLLVSLDGDKVSLQFGNNKVETNKSKLNPIWTGEYRLFWKKPLGMREAIKLGERGPHISWLLDSIRQVDGNAIAASRYNQEVKSWVEGFQKTAGLVADGVVGKHTVILLNNQVSPEIPKLKVGG